MQRSQVEIEISRIITKRLLVMKGKNHALKRPVIRKGSPYKTIYPVDAKGRGTLRAEELCLIENL